MTDRVSPDVRRGRLSEGDVEAMFDRIARSYDRMNTVMTAGLHRRWRRIAADYARLTPGSRVLDVATGTGDFAFELAERVGPSGRVVGVDPAAGMLQIADEKVARRRELATRVSFERGSALELPYEDASFDAVTVGFGARNFADLEKGIREMARVLVPGGRMVILEVARSEGRLTGDLLSSVFQKVVPTLGRFIGEENAYTYLPRSVSRYQTKAEVRDLMRAAGISDAVWLTLAGGLVSIHHGTRA